MPGHVSTVQPWNHAIMQGSVVQPPLETVVRHYLFCVFAGHTVHFATPPPPGTALSVEHVRLSVRPQRASDFLETEKGIENSNLLEIIMTQDNSN